MTNPGASTPRPWPSMDDGARIRLRSRNWTGFYRDADGILQNAPLATDRTAAEQVLAALVRKAELARVNIAHPVEEHRRRLLADRLTDFGADRKARGNTAKQVRLKIGRIRRLLSGCRFVFVAALSVSRVRQYLAELRAIGRALSPFDPDREWFTRAEVAAAIGIKPATVNTLVRRHEARCDSVRAIERTDPKWTRSCHALQTRKLMPFESGCESMTTAESSSGGWDRTTDTRLMKPLL